MSKVLYPKGISEGRIKRSNRNGNEHSLFLGQKENDLTPNTWKLWSLQATDLWCLVLKTVHIRIFQTIIYMSFESKYVDVIDTEEKITEQKRRNVHLPENVWIPVRFYLLPASNHNARSQSPPK